MALHPVFEQALSPFTAQKSRDALAAHTKRSSAPNYSTSKECPQCGDTLTVFGVTIVPKVAALFQIRADQVWCDTACLEGYLADRLDGMVALTHLPIVAGVDGDWEVR